MKINHLRMNISVFLTFFCIFQITAETGLAQKKLEFDLRDVALTEILEEIKSQTDFNFFFERDVIDLSRKTSLKAEGETVDIVLDRLFGDTPVTFTILEKQIVLTRKITWDPGAVNHAEIPLQQMISGTVTDQNGLPLLGVTILVEGTQTGTTTDMDGKYTIAASEGDTLVFSYLGFAGQSVKVTPQSTTIDIALREEINSLEEVEVSVAYGKQKRISIVGAQTSISSEELHQPVANISTMLAGRISGLTGVQRRGVPGYDGADIWIRGLSTFGSGNNPLVLVDGVERSMNNLDPEDIASFTILKDASATAVYGIRGANGVILIETKRGKIGKPKVSVDYNEGLTFFTKMPDLADGVTYMELANEALTTRGQVPKFSEETIERTRTNYDPLLYPNVDWFDAIFKNHGKNRRAAVNVNGGAESAQYYVSLGYYDETGLFVTDGVENYDSDTRFKRYNITTNLTLNITKTTKAELGIQGYLSEGNYPGLTDNSIRDVVNNIFSQAFNEVSPVEYPIMYPGNFVPGRSANGGIRNPYADVAKRGYRNEIKNQLYSNLRLTQQLDFITEGLSWTGMFAFDAFNAHNIIRSKRESTYFVNENEPYNEDGTLNLEETYTGSNYLGYTRRNGGNRRFYLETSLNYDRTFEKHAFSGLVLFNRSDYVDAFAGDFIGSIPFRNQGVAGRVTYSYDQRYFLEFNGGYNGSENFSPENRYGFFPSVAAGWVISNEKFFEPLTKVVNYFKLRYSDGKVGSASGAGRFAYLNRVEDGEGGYDFGENPGYTNGIAETYQGVNVTWAESRKQDFGVEISAFNSDLRIIFDIFKERTEGAFLQRGDVPNYIGLVSDPYGNLGVVENKGFDGTIEYNKSVNDLNLAFRGTFSYNRNKILENGIPEQPYPWLDRRGSPLLARWGYVAERLFTLEDDTDGDGFISPNDAGGFATQFGQVMPGDIKYEDLNGDGKIDAYDRKEIGQGDVPALTYGFGISAEYKGVDVSLFFQGQAEADIILSGNGIMPFSNDAGRGNLFSKATDRWTEENNNPDAMYPRLSFGSSGIGQTNNTQGSTWWLRDVDFLRLKTAEVGYTFPKKLSGKLSLSNARIYLRGTNLLTFSKFKLWDPELLTSNGGAYPNIMVCSVGLNFQF